MSLYDRILNINNVNKEDLIKKAIYMTEKELESLDYERMCLVYSSYLYNNLKQLSCLAYLIDTAELGFDYQHYFILVPDKEKEYYLLDLTYKQFESDEIDMFSNLYLYGYQKINDILYEDYIFKVTGQNNHDISLDDSIFGTKKNLGK